MNQKIHGFRWKKRYIFTAVLLVWGGVILFLSFQNGTDTAATSQNFTIRVLQLLRMDTNDWNLIMLWDHRFRVLAHAATFFVYGMFGAFALGCDLVKHQIWWVLFVLSGIGLAVWAEAGKVQMGIPGRHCDIGEMMLNLAGFVIGFMINVAITALIRKRKERSEATYRCQ